MATTPPDDAWRRLGDALVARRVQLDTRYSNRSTFADETGVDYRVLFDIENAKRTNFSRKTIAEIELAYGLPVGSIETALKDPDFTGFPDHPVIRRSAGAASKPRPLNAVPDWVGAEEARWRMRLHQDAVARGLDKTGHLVDGLNVASREDEMWDLLGDQRSPEYRYKMIIHMRDLDDTVARGGTAGDGEVERGNGTNR